MLLLLLLRMLLRPIEALEDRMFATAIELNGKMLPIRLYVYVAVTMAVSVSSLSRCPSVCPSVHRRLVLRLALYLWLFIS